MLLTIIPLQLGATFGKCSELDPYCVSCDHSSQCLICVKTLLTTEGRCQEVPTPIPNCLIYVSQAETNKLICQECEKNFKIVDNQCVPISLENCLHIENESVPVPETPAVSILSDSMPSGQQDSLFQTVPSNIVSSSSADANTEVCNICASNMLPHFGKCKNISFCSIQNCENCFYTIYKQEKCVKCKQGMTLQKMWNDTNYCVPETPETLDCLYTDLDTATGKDFCAICKVNFYNLDGRCVKSLKYEIASYVEETVVTPAREGALLGVWSLTLVALVLFN